MVQPYNPGSPSPLTAQEKTEIAHFRCIRSAIHEGPYYSVLGDNVRVEKARRGAVANADPFEGMQTWSQRYTKRRRMLPRMEARSHGMSGSGGCGVLGI